jgi:glycosyltransferase involved in cell wall biosynthesis
LGVNNVIVFPNAVNDEEPQFKSTPIKSDKIRFGWLGGSSHLYDLELMQNGISSTHNSFKDKVQFVLCGFDLRGSVTEIDSNTKQQRQRPIQPMETVWYKYEKFFTDDYKALSSEYKEYLHSFTESPSFEDGNEPYRRRWTRDVNTYASNYNYFDVSLAPLVESVFNANKSQLKVIEAGFHKKAIIASDTDPFTLDLISAVDEGKFNDKGNALLVGTKKNHKDWAKHMKRLVENPNMIEDLGNRLYETVKDKYSLRKVCQDRVEFFKSIIK